MRRGRERDEGESGETRTKRERSAEEVRISRRVMQRLQEGKRVSVGVEEKNGRKRRRGTTAPKESGRCTS